MKENTYDIIVIGGSAGSIPVCIQLLKSFKPSCKIPAVLIIHRMRNVESELGVLLTRETKGSRVWEPEDKMTIDPGKIYLAPQNYHLLFEADNSFSLDYSDPVHFSRPSIDVSFESAAQLYGKRVLAILLSGANADGANALRQLADIGATCIVQDPDTAESTAMPESAIAFGHPQIQVLKPEEISTLLSHLC
jgi:two-component system chemotaxis response regulator CheB